jgi:hypothetical protein
MSFDHIELPPDVSSAAAASFGTGNHCPEVGLVRLWCVESDGSTAPL